MKILTIVIPTYNVEKYLDRCLDSLIYDDKILNDLEILIVNDGSKDNSLRIAKEYEEKYPNAIKVVDKENGGHGSTINAGLKLATGKYFRVIDSDDWVNIDDFSKYVNDLKEIDVDAVITNFSRELIYNGEVIKFSYSDDIEYNKIYQFDIFDLKKFKDDYLFMATTTFKTSILKDAKVFLDEKTFYVDMEFILFPIVKLNTMIFLNYDIYRYFIGRPDQSINIDNYVKNRKDHEKVLRRLLDFYENTEMSDNKRRYIFNILSLMCNSHYIIYCKAKLPNKSCINEIRQFDKYFKEISPSLYQNVGNRFLYISKNRKNNFKYAQSFNNIYSRYCDRLERKRG